MQFENLKLVKEYKNFIGSSTGEYWPLRLYTTDFGGPYGEGKVRWHFGVKEEMIPEPMRPLFHTTPFWGEQTWHTTDDGFLLYWTSRHTDEDDDIPEALNRDLDFFIERFNMCLRFLRKAYV